MLDLGDAIEVFGIGAHELQDLLEQVRVVQTFELFLGFAQGRLEAANAEASEDRLHLVHHPCPPTDQVLPLAVRPPRVLLRDGRNRHHAAMTSLAAQPAYGGRVPPDGPRGSAP